MGNILPFLTATTSEFPCLFCHRDNQLMPKGGSPLLLPKRHNLPPLPVGQIYQYKGCNVSQFNCLILHKHRSAKSEQVLYHLNSQLNQNTLKVHLPHMLHGAPISEQLVHRAADLSHSELLFMLVSHTPLFMRCFASLGKELLQRSVLA